MNNIEKAAQSAVPEQGGVLRPLERANGTAPVLGTPALVTAAGVLFVAGNMVLDLVGHESAAKHDGGISRTPGRSISSCPPPPFTGSIPASAWPKPPGCCGPAAGWRC